MPGQGRGPSEEYLDRGIDYPLRDVELKLWFSRLDVRIVSLQLVEELLKINEYGEAEPEWVVLLEKQFALVYENKHVNQWK